MPKLIVILDQERGPGGDRNLRFLLWIPVILGREVPRPGATSLYRDALPEEIQAIQTGAVLEEFYSRQIPASASLAQVRTYLEGFYTQRKNEVDSYLNPNQFYGANWDGSTWTGV